jgi:predicted enzyme related to lactoylglutathione lyase
MVDFYTKAFGWQPQMMGPKMGNYVVVTTSEMDEKTKYPTEPGRINGGLFEKTKDNQHPSVVIAVGDIREGMKAVQEAGGKILGGSWKAGEPDDIPGVGLYISFLDTEDNRVSMIQPSGM